MATSATRKEDEFREQIRETFEAYKKSWQWGDHPDSPDGWDSRRHNDGIAIQQQLAVENLPNYLERAAEQGHAVAEHPKALPHFLTHLKKWEKWELGEDGPQFDDIPDMRQRLFDWYAGRDKNDPESQQEAKDKRTARLRPGGTGMILHGEQGTTKTTAMYWLITNIMHVNQSENVIWQSTLDDTEWQIFGPWATVCLPEGVDVEVKANPHAREYRDVGAFEIQPEDICREVIRYRDPEQLLRKFAARKSGQFYVVYPDPKFRQCQSITGWEYESMWDVDDSDEATDMNHFWFALMESIVHGAEYNDWTTLIGDEAHKWLRQGKGNDEHDWWNKIDDWATFWGDARKKRLSCILSVHKWHELHNKVRDKIRWAGTMNGEDFPSPAPLDGKNKYDQGLGDMCVWNNVEWNHVGYPDLKRNYSVDGDIEVSYPGFEAVKRSKS